MELLNYIGTKKLNDFIFPNPLDSSGRFNFGAEGKLGPLAAQLYGLLGARYKLSEKTALKLSNTNVGTLYNCEVQLVRVSPTFGTVTLADIIVGRPLFWSDKNKFEVTPLATITADLAGISPVVMTSTNAKGDLIPMVVRGDVGVKMSAAITKTTLASNDPVVMAVASNLGVADVLADATNWTNTQLSVWMGKMIEALGTGGDGLVKKMNLTQAVQVYRDGII